MKKYNVIAIIGKSGSGKDTILKEVIGNNSDFHRIVTCTSRPPRENEIQGKDYYFFSYDDFEKEINNNNMIEFSQFNNWYYGTNLISLSKNKVNIGVFNPSGLRMLWKNPDIRLAIYLIDADDKIRLMRSLEREEKPNVKEIIRRFEADEIDFKNVQNEFGCNLLTNNTPKDLEKNIERIKTCGYYMANLWPF